MNVRRFTARTSREALALVKQQLGDEAVVMSTRPCADGVEVLALAPGDLHGLEGQAGFPADADGVAGAEPSADVEQDTQTLAMSTLSFQAYVRERMRRRRDVEARAEAAAAQAAQAPRTPSSSLGLEAARERAQAAAPGSEALRRPARREGPALREELPPRDLAALVGDEPPCEAPAPATRAAHAAPRMDSAEVLGELRSMRGLIEQRFGALAFMEKLQRQPRQALLTQQLLAAGFSPSLTRRLAESLPDDRDPAEWAAAVLERNLATGEKEPALEEAGGIYALVGATGVGKTTSTAKLAAAFAARHGASQLGLVTLDAYRVAAHEQLRTYGRILGVPVHTAHDRASLEDLLDLLSAKRMVLIDTAGTAPRDSRTGELLEMLSHRSINRVLVVNAAAQGETLDEVAHAYGAAQCRGVVLSKIDEALKLGPALDTMIRRRLKVLAVANGQRVPEDWHRLSAQALVQRAMQGSGTAAWRLDASEVPLVFAGLPASVSSATSPSLASVASSAAGARR